MMRLIYSPRSLDDFDLILKHIAEDNPKAAVRLGEDILKTCELLKSHPQMGQQKDDLGKGIHRFTCRGYGIYYRIDNQRQVVTIGRFLHPRLNIAPEQFE